MTGSVLAKGSTLVVASHNEGKVREIRELLVPFGVKTLSAAELGLGQPLPLAPEHLAQRRLRAQRCPARGGDAAAHPQGAIEVRGEDQRDRQVGESPAETLGRGPAGGGEGDVLRAVSDVVPAFVDLGVPHQPETRSRPAPGRFGEGHRVRPEVGGGRRRGN